MTSASRRRPASRSGATLLVPKKRAAGSPSPGANGSSQSAPLGATKTGPKSGQKKQKVEYLDTETEDKELALADVICDFNMSVNELFQLKEYASLVEWDPRDFSVAAGLQMPEIFEYFINTHDYKLLWDEEGLEDLSNLPLRLQRKRLQEREEQLRLKFPFKERVLEDSRARELRLLEEFEKKFKVNRSTSAKRKAHRERVDYDTAIEAELLSDVDFDYTTLKTRYKLRLARFLIPPPIVTHPSHIPSWRPQLGSELDFRADVEDDPLKQIFEYNPQPIEIVLTRRKRLNAPGVEHRIRDFLTNKFKAGILDDAVEISNTPEEFDAVLDQQKNFLHLLRQKIDVDERFELNGDKIEQRKVTLPNMTSKLSDPFRDNGLIVPRIQGATNDLTYIDHFSAQGMAFSRIHQQARRHHMARIRRIAQMVEQHFRKKAGEKERLAREREQNLRKISRLAITAVRKRWAKAYKVFRVIQQEKEEELKQIEGREHLSKMLEHSTQLLEAQLNRSSRENTEAEADSDDDISSSDDSAPEEQGDNELLVDELRKKYANIPDQSLKLNTEAEDDSESELDDSLEGGGLSALYGPSEKSTSPMPATPISLEYSEEQKKLIEANKGKDSALDSDEYSDSLDESDLSEESSSDDEEANGHDESEGKGVHKAGVDDKMEVDDDDKMEVINGSKVKEVPIPPLLRGTLRPYQKQGLNWLASLYNNDTNGILADEMGLGKTIQTIALLAYLALEHELWGPHLIIVPTSVMLNWEMEFKKFAPGFKVLTYYGSPQERAKKRKGWNKPDTFHVCITSYQLVVHDQLSFKRKKWRYMILDEAHNIKNFRSNRWKALLNFNTENRLLLTGTPLQNNLMELWSLLYFLMPSSKVEQMMPEGFANYEDFQQWFGKPVDKILEKAGTGDLISDNVTGRLDKDTRDTVARLHQVLRPYLLRRLKKDVEKQMPAKYEHIVYCRLSKRQRYLYDDFMSRAKTKETLTSGNFLSIINCLMQLRKVCNHPDLFEVRPIVTSFAMPRAVVHSYGSINDTISKNMHEDPATSVSMKVLNFDISSHEDMSYHAAESSRRLQANRDLEKQIETLDKIIEEGSKTTEGSEEIVVLNRSLKLEEQIETRSRLQQQAYLNNLRTLRAPLFGEYMLRKLQNVTKKTHTDKVQDLVLSVPERCTMMKDVIEKFAVVTPPVVALDMKDQLIPVSTQRLVRKEAETSLMNNPLHQAQVKLSIAFPDKQLLQYDCGKLQKLAALLQDLVPNGHRALIFTQMTKVLDILEQFLNIHGYRYLRLDGATKIEDRQLLTERFNRDPKIPVFILSTRSGGLGINLTGADTVIFYDSDWNPAMDKQCQDRCHRIGQMRDVHIYRFVSESTIESNILKKANQKRQLDNVVIQEGDFTTDYLGKFSVRDLLNDTSIITDLPDKPIGEDSNMELLAQAEDEADRVAAKEAMKEVAVDEEDFNEDSRGGSSAPEAKPKSGKLDDADYDEGVGHIDEYMLRYIGEGFYQE